MSESCTCNDAKIGKRIKMTDEEVRKFYELLSKEDVGYTALSAETINGLNLSEEDRKAYIKYNSELLAANLTESRMFLLGLRKKYNIKNLMVDDDEVVEKLD